MSTEEKINLTFLVRLAKTPSHAFEVTNQVYGAKITSHTGIFEGCKSLKGVARAWKMAQGVGDL